MTSISSIPSYSDLGEADSVTKNSWENQLANYSKYEYYYTGQVFDEKVADAELADPPSLYPVGINIVKMLCQSLADATFGEWSHLPVWFNTRHGIDETSHTQDAASRLDGILFHSNAESVLLEMEIQRMLFGASVLRVRPENKEIGVRWLSIKPTAFFPVFDPHNKNRLLKATVLTNITREQAEAIYGIKTDNDEVLFEEYWDLHEHYVKLDRKHKIAKYSGRNPYGVVPFVYIPRMRSVSVYGDSIADDIIPVQDELNMRVADIGEAVNINAHPTRWGINLPKGFNTENYPIGSDVLWDLGRSFGEHVPEVGVLEIQNPVPDGALENIDWLYDWVRTSTFAPPIAFGEDTGGGQRSGITLEIRMWPLIKAVRKHRAYLRTALRQATFITGRILAQKDWERAKVIEAMVNGDVEASFSDIMPRDRAAMVDEVVKRLSTEPQTISLETALKVLGSDSIEEDRIKKMIEEYELDKEPEPFMNANQQPNQKKEQEPGQSTQGKQGA
jgi:hypothetical protein